MVVEHEITLRVRYEETDTMRVVHYSKYATTMLSDVSRISVLGGGVRGDEWEGFPPLELAGFDYDEVSFALK